MKIPASLLLAALLVGPLLADQAPAGSAAPAAPATTVIVPSAVSELAAGYAHAVQQMSPKGLVIYYRGEKGVTPIKGIRSVRASNGVLIITFSAGDMMAIGAESVVMITDGIHNP
jgi:hypothetical protein